MVLRNVCVLPRDYAVPQTKRPRLHSEDGSDMILLNVCILPHDYAVSQPRRPRFHPEDGGNMVLRNVCWCHDPDDRDLDLHRRENFKSRMAPCSEEGRLYYFQKDRSI